MKKRLITALLILLPALAAPWLLAQDEEIVEGTVEESAEEALEAGADTDEAADITEDEEPADSEAEDDDFVPSAQISEDLSVSFPVDI